MFHEVELMILQLPDGNWYKKLLFAYNGEADFAIWLTKFRSQLTLYKNGKALHTGTSPDCYLWSDRDRIVPNTPPVVGDQFIVEYIFDEEESMS